MLIYRYSLINCCTVDRQKVQVMYGNMPFSITTFQEVPFLAPIFALNTQFIRKIKLDFQDLMQHIRRTFCMRGHLMLWDFVPTVPFQVTSLMGLNHIARNQYFMVNSSSKFLCWVATFSCRCHSLCFGALVTSAIWSPVEDWAVCSCHLWCQTGRAAQTQVPAGTSSCWPAGNLFKVVCFNGAVGAKSS